MSMFISVLMLVFVVLMFLIMVKIGNLKFKRRVDEIRRKLEQISNGLNNKEREMESFIYTVSHDLKTPLLNIQGYAQSLLDANKYSDDAKFNKAIEVILTSVKNLNKFVESMAKLSSAGRVVGTPENVDINDVVLSVKGELKRIIDEKNINLIIKKRLPVCYGNKERFYQIFLNLIGNSIKFIDTNKSPVIEIDYNVEGIAGDNYSDDFYEFVVSDNGIGISLDNHEKIFEAFHRVNNQIEGVGLGLAIVKKIVESHGGRIFVESEPNKYSRFRFTLPKGEI